MDEEHENTYKQQDPAPRYHARSAAIVLAAMYGAKTLLGTATPSIESWQNAREGKYGFVQLKDYSGGYQGTASQKADGRTILTTSDTIYERGFGTERTSDSLSEPSWVCSDGGVSYLRLGA